MIVQSPESVMPEPFRTYVKERSESIASVLGDVVGDTDVQLCSRAITPDEFIFANSKGALVYGVIVPSLDRGYKSTLYQGYDYVKHGIGTNNMEKALSYGEREFKKGNRVRIKDPCESDGQGQYTVENAEQLADIFCSLSENSPFGVVLMPHLETILHRVSSGYIQLGKAGSYLYLGREETVRNNGQEVYGGTQLGLFRQGFERKKFNKIEQRLEIPPVLRRIGRSAIGNYFGHGFSLSGAFYSGDVHVGRVSFDTILGLTDNGTQLAGVVDITPRVGGTTPAEVLAIRELQSDHGAICYASSKLIYEPISSPTTGINFVDTDTLVINAKIEDIVL